jgi:hypothetical protein
MTTNRIPTILALASALALGGCAIAPTAPTVMVLPGTQKNPALFQADYQACQLEAQARLAPATEAANNQAASNVVIGTVLGAAVGALLGQGSYNPGAVAAWGAGTGLLMGSSAAGGSSQGSTYSLQLGYNQVFMQCMYQRGHQVPGQVAYPRQGAAASPPPPSTYRAPVYPSSAYPPPNYPAPNYPPPNTAPPVYPPPGNTAPGYPPPNTPPPS